MELKKLKLTEIKPHLEIIKIARDYIDKIGGFEKFAEWGLLNV